MGKQVAARLKKQAFAFYIDSRLSAIKVPRELDILMTDKQTETKVLIAVFVP